MTSRTSTGSVVLLLSAHAIAAYVANAAGSIDASLSSLFYSSTDDITSYLLLLRSPSAHVFAALLGAVVIGFVSDFKSRKGALAAAFLLVGCSGLLLALLPSYALIGTAASILHATLSALFSFGMGAEVSALLILLFDVSPLKRGLTAALFESLIIVVPVIVIIISNTLFELIGPAAALAWGWRVVVFPGASLIVIAMAIFGLPENRKDEPRPPLLPYLPVKFCAYFILMAITMATIITGYISAPSLYALTRPVLMTHLAITAIAGVAGCFVGGSLSDRFAPKFVLATAGVLYLALVMLTLPFASLVDPHHMPEPQLSILSSLESLLRGATLTAAFVAIIDLLPERWRALGIGLPLNLAAVLPYVLLSGSPGREMSNGEVLLHALICIIGIIALFNLRPAILLPRHAKP